MKRNLVLFLLLLSSFAYADTQQSIIKKKDYTLKFESNYSALDPVLKKRMIETFFIVYPKLAETYNKKTLKTVEFRVDTAYKGVAAAYDGKVVFSAQWLKDHPEDIDVITHESMHIVQNYTNNVGPGWLTEGIADYVRYKFGVDNAGAKWSLPDFQPNHHYTNSYRITARFLVWAESKIKPGIVKTLDISLREGTYTADMWKELTGKDLDELWAAYAVNPLYS